MELVLNTFGSALSKDNDCFLVSNKEGSQRISPQAIRSILVARGVQISSDAILLAIEHEIDLQFLSPSGSITGRVWSHKYGSISTIRSGQLAFVTSVDAVSWIKEVIAEKIEGQQALILSMTYPSAEAERLANHATERLERYRTQIDALAGERVGDVAQRLRGLEGSASRIYFENINHFLPADYRFEERSQHPAMDVANAFLNYGYGILYGKIESCLIRVGIDPYLGVLHRNEYNRPVLVYDVIERYRTWIDYIVFSLLMQQVVSEEYYSVREDGSYWLEGLGRRVVIQSVNDFMDEVITLKGVTRSRATHLFLYTQSLAQQFKEYS